MCERLLLCYLRFLLFQFFSERIPKRRELAALHTKIGLYTTRGLPEWTRRVLFDLGLEKKLGRGAAAEGAHSRELRR